jgi:riboflavin kinase / FMN adenylyltransferase
MRVYSGFDRLPAFRRGSAVAVGTFDGLHLGHRKILGRVVDSTRDENLVPLVLTFFPHPARSVGGRDVRLIQTLEQRIQGLGDSGIKGAVVVPLDGRLSRLTGRAFAEKVLAEKFHAREVVVGTSFRFGKDRKSGVADLVRFGREFGFRVRAVTPVRKRGGIVSSSLIRKLLVSGEVEQAARLLGRPYEIEGRVVTGKARGRRLGFPTANIETPNEIVPAGVFITETIWGGTPFLSLTNVGTNPTFGKNPLGIETYVLDYRGRLYGRNLIIRFHRKLRDEKAFQSPEALVFQMNRDLAAARKWGRLRGPKTA